MNALEENENEGTNYRDEKSVALQLKKYLEKLKNDSFKVTWKIIYFCFKTRKILIENVINATLKLLGSTLNEIFIPRI